MRSQSAIRNLQSAVAAAFCLVVSLALGAELWAQKPSDLEKYERYFAALGQEVQWQVQSSKFPSSRKLSQPQLALLKKGEVVIEAVEEEKRPYGKLDDALIHHWRGTILVPGTDLASVIAFAQNYNEHSRFFKDDVVQSRILSQAGNTYNVFFKFRRKKVITVCYNTEHLGIYHPVSSSRYWSESRATKIAELEGCESTKEKPRGRDHGFLWKFDSFWMFEQVGDDVLIECTSLSLSRDIPFGLGILIRGFVDSIPRESLERTLHTFRQAKK